MTEKNASLNRKRMYDFLGTVRSDNKRRGNVPALSIGRTLNFNQSKR